MARLSLADAFVRFGAKPASRLRSLSAIATDGALVLNCEQANFRRPGRGVLRYEDRLSREAADAQTCALLGEHVRRAHEEALPVRLVIASSSPGGGRSFHVRPDLVGKVTHFDGDQFSVDFTRAAEPAPKVTGRR